MKLTGGRLTEIHLEAAPGQDWPLGDPGLVSTLLRVTAHRIGMQPLGEPVWWYVPPCPEALEDPRQDDGGVTAMLPIATSHLAIHTWPLQRKARIVVDSCMDYAARAAAHMAGRWAGAGARVVYRSQSYQGWPGQESTQLEVAQELRQLADLIPANAPGPIGLAARLRGLADRLGGTEP